jgi:hypothetical protein
MERDEALFRRAKELYLSDATLTLKDVADEVGVPYETVRDWSKNENWSTQRSLVDLAALDGDIFKQADAIRKRLFAEIVAGAVGGKDLVSLTDAWRSLIGIQAPTQEEIRRDDLLDGIDD